MRVRDSVAVTTGASSGIGRTTALAFARTGRAVVPAARREEALGNVSSLLGAVAQPYTPAYGMPKHAVRAQSAGLRQKLPLDRGVCTVPPGTIDTPLFGHAADHTGRKAVATPTVHSPERVAQTTVGLARRPRRGAVAGPMGPSTAPRSRFMPGTGERMTAHHTDRTHLSRTESAPAGHGNLHVPVPGEGAVHGGWGGRRRTAIRRLTTAVLPARAVAGVAHRARIR
ncbi:hypothetical protein ACF1BE_06630 [Streptomyces sp. NPDC014991]|uniref:hypothetical protein n=1 Tax=Streptomyces sp. NPDC014991 TaxID=3364935 RepID=UPI0036F98C88